MKPRDYCCCAIPIVNAGVYATLLEQLVAGAVIGVLALATPDIVGAATPSFASWVFGIVCIALAAVQVLGFIAVAREKSILFRRFLSLHLMLLLAAFSLGAAWTVWSAVRHSEAKTDCINDFYDKSDSMQADQADKLCEIFPWVDIGIMGGLLALFGIMHIYLYFVLSSYSSGQVRDHAKYDAINESATAFNDGIPMRTRGQTWDTPVNNADQTVYGHRRQDSSISMSDVMAQPVHKQVDDYSDYRSAYPPQPAHLMEDNTTPKYSENFYGGPSPHGERPPNAQVHPGQ